MKQLFKLLFFVLTVDSTLVSFYIERNPSFLHQNDYLSLLISDQYQTNRIIFKIPAQISHQESFNLRICKKNTFKLLEKEEDKENFLQQNCLNDIYNTIGEVNYNINTILEEKNNNAIFKLCIFGFALPEAEKSFLMSSIYELETKKELNISGLYYNNSEQIVQLVSEAEKLNYRNLFQKQSFQCKMKFQDNIIFDHKKMNRDIFYIKGKDVRSQLIIEYDFNPKFKPIIQNRFQQYLDENQNPEKLHEVKINLLNQLSQKFKVLKKNFKSTVYNIQITETENKKIQFLVKFPQYRNPIEVPVLSYLKKQKYVRFVPVICYEMLKMNKVISHSFLGEYKCELSSQNKILIYKDANEKSFFVFNYNNQAFSSFNIGFKVSEMDLRLQKGKYSMEISGYQNKCDIVFDQKEDLLYLVCYQTQLYRKKKKIINVQEQLVQNTLTFLIMENSDLVQKRQNKIDQRIMNLLLAVGLVTCGVGVGLLFVNVLAGIIVLLVGLVMVLISWLKNRKFGYSHKQLTSIKRSILLQSQVLDQAFKNDNQNVVFFPINLPSKVKNLDQIDITGIPDLDQNLIVEDDDKLLKLHDLQEAFLLELGSQNLNNKDDKHFKVEKVKPVQFANIGFDVDDYQFDLGVDQRQKSITESSQSDKEDFDFLI